MCGIFGVINTKDKIDESKVIAARDILTHRGPDDCGIYFSNCHPEPVEGSFTVALAHRRLSIIDLSLAAHQPMELNSKELGAECKAENEVQGGKSIAGVKESRFVIVFNGEIYNFRDLIPRLTSHSACGGSRLTSTSDTEVILKLYAQYGKETLNMLRGMFAFAIWDDKEKTLFAARDRFGIKPFYFLKNENEFIFSSELKAIKHYKNNLTISDKGIDSFLRTGSVPAPLTIYNEVESLLPGNMLEIDCHPERSRRISIFNYWKFTDLLRQSSLLNQQSTINKNTVTSDSRIEHSKLKIQNPKLKYDDVAKKKIRNALLDSVRSHLVSDVEVGAFLSGGIDSTAIVSLMRQVGQEKIKTVSMVFPGNKLDESKYSRLAAKYYHTEHIEIPFYEKDLIDDFENIMASMDQPTIDGINTYFVSKAAKQAGLKVVLSGLGGDELFGGYPSFTKIPKYKRIKNLPFAKTFMKAAAPLLKNNLPAKAIEYMKNPDTPNAEYKLMRGLFTDDELRSLGWNFNSQTSNVKGQNKNDSVFSKQDYEAEKYYLHHLSFNTEHSTFNYESSIQYPVSSIEYLSSLQYVSMMEVCYYMRNQLLCDSDIFSMVHSLELRVPFVDHLLYENVLPYLDCAFDKNYPKKILIDAVVDIPLELLNRPKMGFTFPFEDWVKRGFLKEVIFENIKDIKSGLGINYQNVNFESLHWSRLWALFVLSRYI